MMGQIINGKEIAKDIKIEIKNYIENRLDLGKKVPTITSILVGTDGGSIYYQNFQEKSALELGLGFNKIKLEENTSEEELKELILKLNEDDNVDGIMLLLPLPKHIDEKIITNMINPNKDLDCLSDVSMGRFYKGEDSFKPCTPNSVITLLKKSNVDMEGANVVIIGRSNIVGKPLFQMFLNENATVTICHSRTKNLKEVASKADILVVAMGKPKFINEDYVKEGAIVIDVGTSNVDGKITGDVDFNNVISKVSMITPVPGGVGSLTTTLLLRNVCEGLK